jgi:hypothetical protein
MNDLLEAIAAIIKWAELNAADEPHRLGCVAKEAAERLKSKIEPRDLALIELSILNDEFPEDDDEDIHPDQAVS